MRAGLNWEDWVPLLLFWARNLSGALVVLKHHPAGRPGNSPGSPQASDALPGCVCVGGGGRSLQVNTHQLHHLRWCKVAVAMAIVKTHRSTVG